LPVNGLAVEEVAGFRAANRRQPALLARREWRD
jgi:hypothetical protein